MLKRFVYLFATIVFFAQLNPIQGTDAARSFIEDLGRRAIESLTKPGASQSQLESSFQSLLEEGFAVQSIGRFVMGRYWSRMSPDQQSRFIPLFENRLKKSYANRFQEYRGVVFKIKDARAEGKHVIVSSTIQKPGGPLTPVDWRVKGGKILDVKVEGVSMSITIRDEYSSLVQQNNGDIETFLNTLEGGSVSASRKRKAPSSDDTDDE
ncbi:MAG: ABC transporter substrate-binding protein [Alphaproteobacteria bacterium]|jgi:phospholipid transport system substrate-binding protein|nr:ABC transporter substrate-binding protein [Alphaproteobacteria bacterium]